MSDLLSIENRLTKLEVAMHAIVDRMNTMDASLAKYATHGQLKTSEANTKNIINSNSILINNLEQKLLTISIPSDTRYYLSTTEIEDFRTDFSKLLAMLADGERLYQSIISYTATLGQK